jgi:hypothetical protein
MAHPLSPLVGITTGLLKTFGTQMTLYSRSEVQQTYDPITGNVATVAPTTVAFKGVTAVVEQQDVGEGIARTDYLLYAPAETFASAGVEPKRGDQVQIVSGQLDTIVVMPERVFAGDGLALWIFRCQRG